MIINGIFKIYLLIRSPYNDEQIWHEIRTLHWFQIHNASDLRGWRVNESVVLWVRTKEKSTNRAVGRRTSERKKNPRVYRVQNVSSGVETSGKKMYAYSVCIRVKCVYDGSSAVKTLHIAKILLNTTRRKIYSSICDRRIRRKLVSQTAVAGELMC